MNEYLVPTRPAGMVMQLVGAPFLVLGLFGTLFFATVASVLFLLAGAALVWWGGQAVRRR